MQPGPPQSVQGPLALNLSVISLPASREETVCGTKVNVPSSFSVLHTHTHTHTLLADNSTPPTVQMCGRASMGGNRAEAADRVAQALKLRRAGGGRGRGRSHGRECDPERRQ